MPKTPNHPARGGRASAGRASNCCAYKDDGSAPFRAITRQVLFGRPELGCELRYFEMRGGRAFDAGAA